MVVKAKAAERIDTGSTRMKLLRRLCTMALIIPTFTSIESKPTERCCARATDHEFMLLYDVRRVLSQMYVVVPAARSMYFFIVELHEPTEM